MKLEMNICKQANKIQYLTDNFNKNSSMSNDGVWNPAAIFRQIFYYKFLFLKCLFKW